MHDADRQDHNPGTAFRSQPVRSGRGRGREQDETDERYTGRGGVFDRLNEQDAGRLRGGPARSVEGYIVLVTNVHEEATEDDIQDLFGEFGTLLNVHLNLDRRTGFVKGYCLVEYEHRREAKEAIEKLHGASLQGRALGVTWAFAHGPIQRQRPFTKRNPG